MGRCEMTEKTITLTESECARIMAAVNFLMGFVQGAGCEVPDELSHRFTQLAEFAGLAMIIKGEKQ